jgi:conjugal transfer pilus assembly protein TraV
VKKVRVCLVAALASGTLMTGCTTMGGNIKGSFSCVAPDGICAPSSTIDDRALAMISGTDGDRMISPAGPYAAPRAEGRGFDTVSATPARSQERVLRIVFPAQIDAAGRLHEQSAVHAVVEQGDWRRAQAGSAVATTPQQVAIAAGGDTLLAAVDRAEPRSYDEGSVDPDMPTPAAVAAARAKADPVGDIKDQVAQRLAKKPTRLKVDREALRTSTSVTYRAQPASTPTTASSGATLPPSRSSASLSSRSSTSSTVVPSRATTAGRNAVAAVAANSAIRSSLARAEPEAREAAKSANPLPVLRASSFPGVVQ